MSALKLTPVAAKRVNGWGQPFIGPIRVVGWRKLRSYARCAAAALLERKQVIVHCTSRGHCPDRLVPTDLLDDKWEHTFIFSEWDGSLAIGPGCVQAVLRFGKHVRGVRIPWTCVRYIEVVDDGVEQPVVDPSLIYRMHEDDPRRIMEEGGEPCSREAVQVVDSLRRALNTPERLGYAGRWLSARTEPMFFECPERQRRTVALLAEMERSEPDEQPNPSRWPFIPGDQVRFTAKWQRAVYDQGAPDQTFTVQRCACERCSAGCFVAVPHLSPEMVEHYGPLRHILVANLERAQLAPAGPIRKKGRDAILAQVGMRVDDAGNYFLRPPWAF